MANPDNTQVPLIDLDNKAPKTANQNKLKPNTIGSIVNQIKSKVTKEIRKKTEIFSIWQRNYYENIIQNDEIHQNIIEYIENNLLKWENDKYYT